MINRRFSRYDSNAESSNEFLSFLLGHGILQLVANIETLHFKIMEEVSPGRQKVINFYRPAPTDTLDLSYRFHCPG